MIIPQVRLKGIEPDDRAEVFGLFVLNMGLALSCLMGRMLAALYVEGIAIVALVVWAVVAAENGSPRFRQAARAFLSVSRLMIALFTILLIPAVWMYPSGIPWARGDRDVISLGQQLDERKGREQLHVFPSV
jgi:hypothetical protein